MISSWLVWAEIECTVHVSLPKQPINQFKPVQQSRYQVLRAYCPYTYILWDGHHEMLDSLKPRTSTFHKIVLSYGSLPERHRATEILQLITVRISGCSRDSRPGDWSRLGAFLVVSVSPNISRDSRD